MKFIHAADLHLGKRLYELSLKEDQEHMLKCLLNYVKSEQADALVLAGDIYDKSQPAAETVEMMDDFLYDLAALEVHVFIVAGNHDSPSRLAYGRRFFERQNIHIAGDLSDFPELITLEDEHGPVNFLLLPYFRLYEMRALFPEDESACGDYEDAVRRFAAHYKLKENERNILISHQHYAADGFALISDSEMNIIGGLEACDSRVLEGFTYAALGHLHRPQTLRFPHIRYSGSPICYSFSELGQAKSFPLVELGPAGEAVKITELPIEPLHPMDSKEGLLRDLLAEADLLPQREREAYLRIVLTDEERLDHPLRRLQMKYPNVLQLSLRREEKIASESYKGAENPQEKGLMTLFLDFYKELTEHELSDDEEAVLKKLLDEIDDAERREHKQ